MRLKLSSSIGNKTRIISLLPDQLLIRYRLYEPGYGPDFYGYEIVKGRNIAVGDIIAQIKMKSKVGYRYWIVEEIDLYKLTKELE